MADGVAESVDEGARQYNPEHARGVRRVTWGGLIANVLLAAAKFVGGLVGHSQAVVADAVHSLTDLTTDFAVLVGLRYWSAPADHDHPYGHRRIETLISAMIGLLLAVVGLGIAYNGIASLGEPAGVAPGWLALAATILSIVVKEGLYRWTVRVGTRIRSSALIANAWHHRSDAFSSLPAAAAVGIAMVVPGWGFVDGVGAVVVALFILYAAWQITVPAAAELVDRGASEEVYRQLEQVAREVEGVQDVHALRTRYVSSRLVVDLHVLVDGELTVREGHDVSENVKHRLLAANQDVVDVVVHLEPDDDHERSVSSS